MGIQTRTALIVGAGIGGLAAGLALRRAGWRVRIFERATTPRELGFALLLAPNAMHALGQLGIADRVREGGAIVRSGEMRRPDGTVLRRFDAQRVARALGEDSVCVLRPVLHGTLLDAVGSEALVLGSTVTDCHRDGDEVALSTTDGRREAGHVLIGADGVASVIRRRLHPEEPPARRSGLAAFRGVALDVVQHLGGTSGAQYFGRGLEAGVARASDRAVYWYLSIREDCFPPGQAGQQFEPAAAVRSLTAHFHEPFRAIVAATPADQLRIDRLLTRPFLSLWGSGPVTLLGDAAHPMLPHAGQGAAQAIEDAVALGRVLTSTSSPAEALRAYERQRVPRTRAVVQLSQRNARLGSLTGAVACAARDAAIRMIPDAVILKSLIALGRPPGDAASLRR